MENQALIQQLQRRIERIETGSRADDGNTFSSGSPIIDRMLPAGGYRRGTLIQWIAAPTPARRNSDSSGGCAVDFLSLLTAANACADGGALVVADRSGQFYPPAATALGLDAGNMVVIQPPDSSSQHDARYDEEFFWAVDQSLRCSAVAAVWVVAPHIGERWFRRFQLAAESSGTMGLFVSPPSALGKPGWSEVQWGVQSIPGVRNEKASGPAAQRIRLQLLRCRGGQSGGAVDLQIDSASGKVSMTGLMSDLNRSRDRQNQSLMRTG